VNNQVSEILKEIINENGIGLCNNRIKLQGLLSDLCGENKKEIDILIVVLQSNIINEILNMEESIIDNFKYNSFVNKVCKEAGTLREHTLWAVKSWIEALGKKLNSTENKVKSNIPVYLEHLYIGSLNESILKKYSFEDMPQYMARIENIQCVAFGKARLTKYSNLLDQVIFTVEVRWDNWIKKRHIINEGLKLSVAVDKDFAENLYKYKNYFPINGKLKVVDGSIKIKQADIHVLGKTFSVTFYNDKIELEDKAILIKAIGEWIYYCSEVDGYKLYKIKTDGTSKTLVSGDRTLNINIIDDWIFYSNGSDYFKIYKIKIDGSQKSIVCEDVTSNLRLVGEWIYYSNYQDMRKPYKIKIDGTGRCIVNEDEEAFSS
jgi:hypothetical protein